MYLQVKEIHASFVMEEKLSMIDGKVEAVIRWIVLIFHVISDSQSCFPMVNKFLFFRNKISLCVCQTEIEM